jgi:signal transduction histidine kinase
MEMTPDKETRRLLALLLTIPLAFSLLFFVANQIGEHIDLRFVQLQNLASSLNRILSLCKDVEIGERGFLLTGDDRSLALLQQARAWFPGESNLCRNYSKDQPALQRRAEHVISLARQRIEQANKILEIQRTQGVAAAIELAKSGDSQKTMDLMRNGVNDLETEINRLQGSYLAHERALNNWAFIVFIVGTVIMISVLVLLYHALLHFIHGRDAAQKQLQALNAELEARIDERTRELKDINEELQQFAYAASHDLQEPLRTITSFTQLLANRYRGALDEDADEFIGYIVSSSRRMNELIDGLLALVRLRKGGPPTAVVAFEELLEEAKDNLQAAIRESNAEIEHGPLPALVVDRVQFAQLFQNLISNAIKYRRDERPFIRVQVKRDATDWTFAVSDNGQGFDKQYAEQIFALFQRLHGRDVEGTGMGLSISRRIVERHGGRIWAESQPGIGSTFRFTLPVSLEAPRKIVRVQAVNGIGNTR